MLIIRNEVQKEYKFKDIKVGTVFKVLDCESLFLKTHDLIIYTDSREGYLYNVICLDDFEIGEIQDFEDVIVFEKSFLTVE